MDRRYERVYRQRVLQAEHDGNIFGMLAWLAGLFVGLAVSGQLFL